MWLAPPLMAMMWSPGAPLESPSTGVAGAVVLSKLCICLWDACGRNMLVVSPAPYVVCPRLAKLVPSCQKVTCPLHLGRKSLAGLSRMQHGKPVIGVMPRSLPRELAPETLGGFVRDGDCYPHCVPGRMGVESVLRRLWMSSSSVGGRLRSPWSCVR